MTPATAKTGQKDPSEAAVQSPTQYPVGVDAILKMLQAGVSKDVVKTYIETAQVATRLSAADLVTLKERGVPDDLTVALMKRGAELAAQANESGASNAAPAKVTGTISLNELAAVLRSRQFSGGSLDPEGYDYFQRYYLYPRTLADANQRLLSSYPFFRSYGAYSPGFYSPWAFSPPYFAPPFRGP